MFACDEVALRLGDWLDGELAPVTRLQVRLHLVLCARCRAMERSLRRTVRLLRDLHGSGSLRVDEMGPGGL